jgi:hypothetical protein
VGPQSGAASDNLLPCLYHWTEMEMFEESSRNLHEEHWSHPESPDRWQPDWVFVSHELKRIAIVDLCRPSDVHPDQLKAVAIHKQEGYKPLLSILSHCIDKGWTVQIFPWVLGICRLIDPNYISSLKFPRYFQQAQEGSS